jgi:hypothetical protein
MTERDFTNVLAALHEIAGLAQLKGLDALDMFGDVLRRIQANGWMLVLDKDRRTVGVILGELDKSNLGIIWGDRSRSIVRPDQLELVVGTFNYFELI